MQKSIIVLSKEVWNNVILTNKRSVCILILISWLLHSYAKLSFGLSMFAIPIKIILLQVLSTYVVITEKDNLFLNQNLIKLFKESFMNLLGLYLMQILMLAIISLMLFVTFKLYSPSTISQVATLVMVLMLTAFSFIITVGMTFAPYHSILECGTPLWSFKKGLLTARQNIRLITTIFLAKFILILIFVVKSVHVMPFLAIMITALNIMIDIITTYCCIEEVKNDQ
jgi:hypothetical protein